MIRYKHQLKQAYYAGIITALIFNKYYNKLNNISLVECMRDFYMLKTKFGHFYTIVKQVPKYRPYFVKYEELGSVMENEDIGTYEDFMFGYCIKRKKEKI